MKHRNIIQRLAAPFAIALITLLPACQKCETCSYSYPTGNGAKETYTFPETCGDKNRRESQRHACETMAALAGTTCKCSKS